MDVIFYNMVEVDISTRCLFELYDAETIYQAIKVYGKVE